MCEIGGNSAEALTTEALGATELGTWVSILSVFLTSMWFPSMAVSLNGAASPGHAVFVCQILYSLIVNKSWNLQH